jgi:hypothetical protein
MIHMLMRVTMAMVIMTPLVIRFLMTMFDFINAMLVIVTVIMLSIVVTPVRAV